MRGGVRLRETGAKVVASDEARRRRVAPGMASKTRQVQMIPESTAQGFS